MMFNENVVGVEENLSEAHKIAMMVDGDEEIDYKNLPSEKFVEIFSYMKNPDKIVNLSRVNKNALVAARIASDQWLRDNNLPRSIPALVHWLVQSPFWKFEFPQLTYRQKIAAVIQMKGKITFDESRRLLPDAPPEVLMATVSEMHNETSRLNELLPMLKKIRIQVTRDPDNGETSFITMETFFYSEVLTPRLGENIIARIKTLLEQVRAEEDEKNLQDDEKITIETSNNGLAILQVWHSVGINLRNPFVFVYDDDTEMMVASVDVNTKEPLQDESRLILMHSLNFETPNQSWVTYGILLRFPDLNQRLLKNHDWERFAEDIQSYTLAGKRIRVNLPE